MTHAADADFSSDAGRGVYVSSLAMYLSHSNTNVLRSPTPRRNCTAELVKMQRMRCTKQRTENNNVMSICCCLSCSLPAAPVCCYFFLARESTIAFFKFLHSFAFVHLFTSLAHTHTHAHPHTYARLNERRVKKRVEMPERERLIWQSAARSNKQIFYLYFVSQSLRHCLVLFVSVC